METWYNVADVHRHKGLRDSLASYRGRIAHSHARWCRSFDLQAGEKGGRRQRITVTTAEGIRVLFMPDIPPKLTPYPVPLRLSDKARGYIVEGSLFSTKGLEKTGTNARVLSREQFLEFVHREGYEELYEADFVNL